MPLSIHPDAARNFDEKIADLRTVTTTSTPTVTPSRFLPDRPVAGVIDDTSIVSVGDLVFPDWDGVSLARFRRTTDGVVGLSGKSYADLRSLAERLARTGDLKSRVGREFIESVLFDWVVGDSQEPATERVLAAAEQAIEHLDILVPIQGLEPETSFRCGRVEVVKLDRQFFDRWRAAVMGGATDATTAEAVENIITSCQERTQALGAAKIVVEAERGFAFDLAVHETERAIGALRLFAPANIIPAQTCFCATFGDREVPRRLVFFGAAGSEAWGLNEALRVKTEPTWALSARELADVSAAGLTRLSGLLAADDLSAFEAAVVDACLLYSRACLHTDAHDRLVYHFAAIESLLLENDSEPIVSKVAESMAFALGGGLEERKRIKRTVKETYGLRSKFVHHGHELATANQIAEFSVLAWRFMLEVLRASAEFSTASEYISMLEDRKLS